MKQSITKPWMSNLKQELLRIDPSIELILYGSRARGTATQDSDWDFLLLTDLKKLSLAEEKKIRMLVYLQELAIGEAFSLQIFNKKEWHNKYHITPYYQNIQKEGIEL